jgi:hypothetical protein
LSPLWIEKRHKKASVLGTTTKSRKPTMGKVTVILEKLTHLKDGTLLWMSLLLLGRAKMAVAPLEEGSHLKPYFFDTQTSQPQPT